MKPLIIITFFLLTVKLTVANEIDNLKTKGDVEKFLKEKVNNKWEEFTFFEKATKDTSAYGKNNFFKLDLDNNGLTDIVINGKYFFAVTDKGNKTYGIHSIDRGAFQSKKYSLTNIIYINKVPLLLIKSFTEYNEGIEEKSKTDTLILKFNNFIEYNSTTDNLQIEEINFSTSGCYGTCPIFELSITADRNAIFNAIEYNSKKGHFKTIIDTISYNKLVRTINYIKLTSLQNNYRVDWTDDQTATLEIKFNNGQIKKISDYGEIGTFGLENLYEQLFALRQTQKWK